MPLSPMVCRKAAVVLLGLFRLVYQISKGLRLTSWQISIPTPLLPILQERGYLLEPLDYGHYRARLADLKEKLVDFKRLRKGFWEVLELRPFDQPELKDILMDWLAMPPLPCREATPAMDV